MSNRIQPTPHSTRILRDVIDPVTGERRPVMVEVASTPEQVKDFERALAEVSKTIDDWKKRAEWMDMVVRKAEVRAGVAVHSVRPLPLHLQLQPGEQQYGFVDVHGPHLSGIINDVDAAELARKLFRTPLDTAPFARRATKP